MGFCSHANLSWGLIIPEDKLVAILKCLRKHEEEDSGKEIGDTDGAGDEGNKEEENNAGKEEVDQPAKKRKLSMDDDDTQELDGYLHRLINSPDFDEYFHYRLSGQEEPSDSDVQLSIVYKDIYEKGEERDVRASFGPYVERWGDGGMRQVSTRGELTADALELLL